MHFSLKSLLVLVTITACSPKDKINREDVINAVDSPVENRFVRTVLVDHLNEPMELAVANNNVVYFTERTGAVKRYDPSTNITVLYDSIPVNPVAGNGLVGVTLDPHFDSNQFIYFFYTPREAPLRHQVSRFVAGVDHLDKFSEKVLLKIPIELEEGAHTGGSLQFDGAGNLFIAVGDNTDPSQSDGYAPIDERKGRIEFDAQRTSANTNNLRGKILRITPQPDGGYAIPDGNLFPKDGTKGEPEIYVMGCRNPYRIAVDTKTNYLYWGEIGPDAGVDTTQGPKGYDEFNQAKRPGYFGWPYFVGDSKAYHDYDFATKDIGVLFNAANPINESPNNTGSKNLPPAESALVWYPYDKSNEFPEVHIGGRSAMAGAVYQFDDDLNSDLKLPAYYDGDVFVFDWMRNWVMAIKLDDQYNFKSMERIMPATKIDKPIDLAFATDGSMYMLEYGEDYGLNNADASLVRITFNAANRKPVAIVQASDSIGQFPLTVKLSGNKSYDFDAEDSLTYSWSIDSLTVGDKPETEYVFKNPGIFKTILTVTDQNQNSDTTSILIKVGNTIPELTLTSTDNSSFYLGNKNSFDYQIHVTDREDKIIDPARIKVSAAFMIPSRDNGTLQGHQKTGKAIGGKDLIDDSDCKSCHTIDKRTIGPSFKEISMRYKKVKPIDKLADKIIHGGAGVWGEHTMSAHPQLTHDEASAMAKYIVNLTDESSQSLSPKGKLKLLEKINQNKPGVYVLTASYTDNGGSITPFTGTLVTTLRNPRVQAEDYDALYEMQKYPSGTGIGFQMGSVDNGSYLVFKKIDLKSIKSLTYRIASKDRDATIELHLDSPDGLLVNSIDYKATGDWEKWIEMTSPLKSTQGIHDLYFVVVKKSKPDSDLLNLDWIQYNGSEKLNGLIGKNGLD